jgi:hypothetical protein
MSTIATPDRFTTLPDEPMIERIYQHSLVLEDARAIVAYGQHSSVGKIPKIRQELPGRIHIVLVRQAVGF